MIEINHHQMNINKVPLPLYWDRNACILAMSEVEASSIWMDKTVEFPAVRFNNLQNWSEPSDRRGVMQMITLVMHFTIDVNTSVLPPPVGMTSSAFVSVRSRYRVRMADPTLPCHEYGVN